ncbi:MAG: serine hydrolase, partial [Leptospiraceae bacterium]|nr:serine hydrolase [Leptospiraceae bacterium]
MKILKPIVYFSLFISLLSCSSFPNKPEKVETGNYSFAKKYLDYLGKEAMDKNKIRGLAITVMDEKEILFEKNYGEEKEDTAFTETSPFRIASVSKLFTALSIMQLVEKKKLNLKAPLKKYIPEFRLKNGSESKITLEMLLAHRSGLPSVAKDFYINEGVDKAEDILVTLSGMDLIAEPGTKFQYCNTCYNLLSKIIEKVSKQNYEDYIKNQIFIPLEMNSSEVFLKDINSVYGYERLKLFSAERVKNFPIRDRGAGSIISNLSDMKKFLQFLLAPERKPGIVKSESLQRMYELLFPDSSEVRFGKYGIGFMVNLLKVQNSELNVGHGGDLPGFTSALFYLPQDKLGGIVFANTGTARMARFKLLNEGLSAFLEAKTGKEYKLPQKEERKFVPLDDKELSSLVGFYQGAGIAFSIEKEGNSLTFFSRGQKLNLQHLGNQNFGIYIKLLGLFNIDLSPAFFLSDSTSIKFEKQESGKIRAILQMKYAGFQIDTISEKVEWEEDRELYKHVLGNYLITEDSLRHTDKSFLPVNRIQLLKVKDKPLLIRNFAEKQMMAEVYGSYESANT